MSTQKRSPGLGIEARHLKACASHAGRRCNCTPSYRAKVRDRAGNQIKCPWQRDLRAVVAWRQEAVVAVRQGKMKAAPSTSVRDAGEALVDGMRARRILNRSGVPYKPGAVRSYELALRKYAYPALGGRRLSSLERRDLQLYVERLTGLGLSPSSVHNKLDPLRVLVRRALDAGELSVDPFTRLSLPAVRNSRERIESPDRAFQLIAALPPTEQAFWALAFFAGLRRGELRALTCDDVDFDAEVIHVRRGWDDVEGAIEPKSFAGKRTVPMTRDPLRRILRAHKLSVGRRGADLFLGRSPAAPFIPSTVRARALKAWTAKGLEPLTPHEARHCAASYWIACGWDWKKVQTYVGHSDIRTTMNRYAKLVPGDERDAAAQLDGYLSRHRQARAQ